LPGQEINFLLDFTYFITAYRAKAAHLRICLSGPSLERAYLWAPEEISRIRARIILFLRLSNLRKSIRKSSQIKVIFCNEKSKVVLTTNEIRVEERAHANAEVRGK
jgi:hypothetical protein